MTTQTEPGSLRDARKFYAAYLSAIASATDRRLLRAFEQIPREGFLPPGPWRIFVPGGQPSYVDTPSANPIHLYQDLLIVLDPAQGINNGQPSLHARWLAAVAPQAGDTVVHIGAGTGYYTAVLSHLVASNGRVIAFEIDQPLAAAARDNLRSYENVELVATSAMCNPLPPADIVYVNAGASAPHETWLAALRPGGRLVFPWAPTPGIEVAVVVTRDHSCFAVRTLGRAFFIPCAGADDFDLHGPVPDLTTVLTTHSLHLSADRAPDGTATAVYDHLWFSSAGVTH